MKKYTAQEIEALTNWDGLLCKPPFRNELERRQHYARYLSRYLWRYLTDDDWKQIAQIIDHLRIDPKIKKATKFLLHKHGY